MLEENLTINENLITIIKKTVQMEALLLIQNKRLASPYIEIDGKSLKFKGMDVFSGKAFDTFIIKK